MFLESQSNIYRLEMIISPKQNGFLITVFQECLKKGAKRPNYIFRQHHFGITTWTVDKSYERKNMQLCTQSFNSMISHFMCSESKKGNELKWCSCHEHWFIQDVPRHHEGPEAAQLVEAAFQTRSSQGPLDCWGGSLESQPTLSWWVWQGCPPSRVQSHGYQWSSEPYPP